MNKKNIIAIIPARSGSKGIPKKNIIDFGGFPLIAYSIVAANLSMSIGRVIVSTDSKEIADIALKYGAEVPFLRPKEYSSDNSLDIEFIKHALNWLKENENFEPEYIVHLRPTTPLRNEKLIDEAVEKIIKNKEATSLRSAHELRESPHKFFEIREGFFEGLFPEDSKVDSQNLPRQKFKPAYHPNGYVDVLKIKTINELNVIHGNKILPFITPFIVELDSIEDLEYMKFDLQRGNYKIFNYLKEHF